MDGQEVPPRNPAAATGGSAVPNSGRTLVSSDPLSMYRTAMDDSVAGTGRHVDSLGQPVTNQDRR
jgi:hypothetical protein